MKKIYMIIIMAAIIFAGISVFGEVVTTRKINPNKQPQAQKQVPSQKLDQTPAVKTIRPTGNKLADNIMMCKPYSEKLNSNLGGVDFTFNVKIDGWVNNKCRLDFTAQSTGINSMFQSLYGVEPSQATIMTFEPKIRCEFTKQQLITVGDSILQEEERNSGAKNNMLKNPSDIEIPTFGSMTESDSKLMNVILNDRACNILNTQDSNSMFESLFGF